jgi:uncharacterized membrane protein YeaQ/YmgE (transglycosylase-associated protein family)
MGYYLSFILFGFVAGAIAKAIHPGKDPGGWIGSIVVGIAGSFLGNYLGGMLFTPPTSNWSLRGFLFAIAGAVVLLILYRLLFGKKS